MENMELSTDSLGSRPVIIHRWNFHAINHPLVYPHDELETPMTGRCLGAARDCLRSRLLKRNYGRFCAESAMEKWRNVMSLQQKHHEILEVTRNF